VFIPGEFSNLISGFLAIQKTFKLLICNYLLY